MLRVFLISFFFIGVSSRTPKEIFCNKVLEIGITTHVTSNTTACKIATCVEPSIIACKSASNLTSDLLNCIMNNSGSYYVNVIVNSCIGGDTLKMLERMGIAIKPLLMPLYDTMTKKLKEWIAKKLAKNAILNNWYTWMNNQATRAFANKCCTKIVQSKNISAKEWTCSKDPNKGGKAFNTKLYDCSTMMPPTSSLL